VNEKTGNEFRLHINFFDVNDEELHEVRSVGNELEVGVDAIPETTHYFRISIWQKVKDQK